MGRAAVAAAVVQVEGMSLAELAGFLETLAGMQRVQQAGWRLKERRLSQERYAARNAEIRRRHRKGESYGQLALDYGISPSGIAKIVQRGRQFSVDAQTMSIARAR